MKRRHVLARIGAGMTVGIAGCIGGTDTSDDRQDRNDSRPEANPSTETQDGNPNSGASTTPLDDQPCPPSDTDREKAICSHTDAADSAPVYLEPDPNEGTLVEGLPDQDITLTLYNQSSTDLRFNPHSWRIWNRSDSGWQEFEQGVSADGSQTLEADGTRSWSLTEAVTAIQQDPVFEPGLVAASIGVPDPGSSDGWISCVALVDLSRRD